VQKWFTFFLSGEAAKACSPTRERLPLPTNQSVSQRSLKPLAPSSRIPGTGQCITKKKVARPSRPYASTYFFFINSIQTTITRHIFFNFPLRRHLETRTWSFTAPLLLKSLSYLFKSRFSRTVLFTY
jgi:hypothetical protein